MPRGIGINKQYQKILVDLANYKSPNLTHADVGPKQHPPSVKDSHTRIKPLALASGHGRYMIVKPERTLLSVGRWGMAVTC
jgi:hypothetical protein